MNIQEVIKNNPPIGVITPKNDSDIFKIFCNDNT